MEQIDFKKKYIKYKSKYLNFKKQLGSGPPFPGLQLPALSLGLHEVSAEDITNQTLIDSVIDNLKYMNLDAVNELYEDAKKIEQLTYIKLFNYYERTIIYVKNMTINSEIIDINQAFYKSTGTSRRGTDISQIWLPTNGIQNNAIAFDCDKTRLIKSEDEYILNLESRKMTLDDKRKLISVTNLGKYKRFINENNLAISNYLFTNEIIGDYDSFSDSKYCKLYNGEEIDFNTIAKEKQDKEINTLMPAL